MDKIFLNALVCGTISFRISDHAEDWHAWLWLPNHGGHWDLWARGNNIAAEPKSTQGLRSGGHRTTCAEGACKRDCTCTGCSFLSPPCLQAQFQLTREMHTSHLSTRKESSTTLPTTGRYLSPVLCASSWSTILCCFSAVMCHFEKNSILTDNQTTFVLVPELAGDVRQWWQLGLCLCSLTKQTGAARSAVLPASVRCLMLFTDMLC